MSIAKKGMTAIGRLAMLAGLLGAFFASLAGVVYMSLSGNEIRVPDLVGRDFVQSEKELASLGLKIKRRADRPSSEKINTILEQLPRPGETVKTGQLILVVTSKAGIEPDTPKSLIEDIESDDTKKIEEMISDKPKKAKSSSNSNTSKKVAETTRDVISNSSASGADEKAASDPDKTKPSESGKTPEGATAPEKNKVPAPTPAAKPTANKPQPNTKP